MDYIKRSDAEIRQLAIDINNGSVVTDRCLQDEDQIDHIFRPLAHLGDEDYESLRKLPIGLIYEYRRQANAQDNGSTPTFDSFQYLDAIDAERLDENLNRMQAFRVVS